MKGAAILLLPLFVCQMSAMGLGGLTPSDANNPDIRTVAEFAVRELGPGYNITSVISAQTQVVAGTLYHFDLEVSKTSTRGPPKTLTCQLKVHEMVWVPYMELTEHCCQLREESQGAQGQP